jgi:hypothetical protein
MAGGTDVKLERGRLILVALDPWTGHEQRGVRPCVVVGHVSQEELATIDAGLSTFLGLTTPS